MREFLRDLSRSCGAESSVRFNSEIALPPPRYSIEENSIRRLPEERIHRSFSALRAIHYVATVCSHREQVAAVKSFIAHYAFDECNRFAVGRPTRNGDFKSGL